MTRSGVKEEDLGIIPTILTLNIDAVQNWHATKAESPKPIPNRSSAKDIALSASANANTNAEEVNSTDDIPRRGPIQSQIDPIATRAIIVPETAAIPANTKNFRKYPEQNRICLSTLGIGTYDWGPLYLKLL